MAGRFGSKCRRLPSKSLIASALQERHHRFLRLFFKPSLRSSSSSLTSDRAISILEIADAAFTRTFVVLDGMGYSPTNLPPSSPIRTN
jgi:hypothetical protein